MNRQFNLVPEPNPRPSLDQTETPRPPHRVDAAARAERATLRFSAATPTILSSADAVARSSETMASLSMSAASLSFGANVADAQRLRVSVCARARIAGIPREAFYPLPRVRDAGPSTPENSTADPPCFPLSPGPQGERGCSPSGSPNRGDGEGASTRVATPPRRVFRARRRIETLSPHLPETYDLETDLFPQPPSPQIRFTRLGRKRKPFYRIIAIDSRKRRDGAPLEVRFAPESICPPKRRTKF